MNEEHTEEELIELARRAKPVPVEGGKPKKTKKENETPVIKFITDIGLSSGNNPVSAQVLYGAYKDYAINPKPYKSFVTDFTKYIVISNEEKGEKIYNLNMKGSTAIVKVRNWNESQKEKTIEKKQT